MNIGVKFCGGCNSHFDRSKMFNKVIDLFKDDKFEYAKENKFYDIILVINGCGRVCADYSSLKGKEIIFINSELDYKNAVDLIYKHRILD